MPVWRVVRERGEAQAVLDRYHEAVGVEPRITGDLQAKEGVHVLYERLRRRCKLLNRSLQDSLATIRSKSYTVSTDAWFALHSNSRSVTATAVTPSYCRSMRV